MKGSRKINSLDFIDIQGDHNLIDRVQGVLIRDLIARMMPSFVGRLNNSGDTEFL